MFHKCPQARPRGEACIIPYRKSCTLDRRAALSHIFRSLPRRMPAPAAGGTRSPSETAHATYHGHRRTSYHPFDIPELVELRAHQRTFDNAYLRTMLATLAYGVVVCSRLGLGFVHGTDAQRQSASCIPSSVYCVRHLLTQDAGIGHTGSRIRQRASRRPAVTRECGQPVSSRQGGSSSVSALQY